MIDSFTPKQRAFIEAYLTNGQNGKQAAISAGYSANAAEVTAAKLVRSGKVSSEIASRTQKAVERVITRTDISVERTLEYLGRMAFFDPIDLFEDDGSIKQIKDISEETRSVIAGLEVSDIWDSAEGEQKSIIGTLKKVKLSDRGAALDKLMRYHSLYKDKAVIPEEIVVRVIKCNL